MNMSFGRRHSRLLRTLAVLLAMTLLAPVFPTGALALSDRDPLLRARLDGDGVSFTYTPVANSEYALYIFSADGEAVHAEASLSLDGAPIARGSGSGELLTAWLAADTQYSFHVSGSGNAVVEVARNTLSRCYAKPLDAGENTAQGKMIAREFDAHWYRFTASSSSLMMLTCVPEASGLDITAALFDDAGALVAEFETLPGGACMLLAGTLADRDYYLRVCAPGGGTGYYSLNLHRSDGPEFANALRFGSGQYSVSEGGSLSLKDEVEGRPLLWVSEDPRIAEIDQQGMLRGVSEGETRITVYGLSSSASCRVAVEHVPLERIEIPLDEIRLQVGGEFSIPLAYTPENASAPRLRYIVEDMDVADMKRAGVIRGVSEGETSLTVRSADGSVSDSLPVVVEPAERKYRALLIGEQNYPFSKNKLRTGSEESVQALKSLLENTSARDGAAFSVETRSDLSRAELIAAIRESFAGATEQDVSLFYINCHGSFRGGMSFLELSDGATLSARDLERELRAVPGTVVVLIDCCGSGGAIGAYSDRLAFAQGINGAFSGAAIRGSKYKVLTSAALDQDSFRIAFNENADAGVMATVFVRALCDGAGWSIDRNARKAMDADRDYDGRLSLNELHSYMSARVNWYLELASELTGGDFRQSVQVYPEGDPFILFER